MTAKRLLFRDVDELAFATARGKLDRVNARAFHVPDQLGPLMELLHLSAVGRHPHFQSLLTGSSMTPLVAALGQQAMASWVSRRHPGLGYIRAMCGGDASSRLTAFLMRAKRAGREISGLSAAVSGQLVAAMRELESNIHEHSGAPRTGVLAYKAEPGDFEFVAADHGMGMLRSLRQCNSHVDLSDEGKALEAGLTDGVSRYGTNINRGYGFRPIFIGLANLYGELRFRSGDHALMMDGTSPGLSTASISQKAPMEGFLVSVRCHVEVPQSGRAGHAGHGEEWRLTKVRNRTGPPSPRRTA